MTDVKWIFADFQKWTRQNYDHGKYHDKISDYNYDTNGGIQVNNSDTISVIVNK